MDAPAIRMYVDENGHQSLKGDLSNPSKRYLCLTGIIMPITEHTKLTQRMDGLKQNIFGRTDIILHRRELIGCKPPFEILRDNDVRTQFNNGLLSIVKDTKYRVISVVIDKMRLYERYGIMSQDPYALALEYLMQRYQYWLQDYNKKHDLCVKGDILAESRGGSEDKLTKETYRLIFDGKGYNPLQNAAAYYSSKEIKLKPKKANIAGLQFVDIISHPARRYILSENGLADNIQKQSFEQEIVNILIASKFRRNSYTKNIDGYGTILYPKTLE